MDEAQTLTGSLWEVLVFTIGGLPGSLVRFFFSSLRIVVDQLVNVSL